MPNHQELQGARARDGRGLLRGGRRCPARRAGRRRRADRAGAGAPELSGHGSRDRGRADRGGRRDSPGLRFPRREPALRRAGRGRGLHLDRPAPEDHRGHGRQGAGAPARQGRGRAGAARQPALRARGSLGLEEEALRVGYPLLVKAAAGGGGIGMQRVEGPEKLRGVVEFDPGHGRARVRRRHRLSRALHPQGAPRRDPGVRPRRRPRRASVRARLLDPAPLSEDHRGDPGARARRCHTPDADERRPRPRSPRRSATAAPARSSSWWMRRPRSSSSSR